MRIQVGKKTQDVSSDELKGRMDAYQKVLIDIGTGDGLFVYRWAAENPDVFCIGVDAVGENMREASSKSLKKPARGGRPNTLFVVASVESLPVELNDTADTITVNFPWGSLLKALVLPEAQILKGVARLAKPRARFVALLNYSVFKDQDYSDRIGLPALNEETITEVLKPAYAAASIHITGYAFLGKEVPHRTSWGQRLILGGARETLMIEGLISDSGADAVAFKMAEGAARL